MILEMLEFMSVLGDRGADFLCKFCYGEEELNGWLRPCKCCGTLKWVHRSCFDMWMKKAPAEQQAQCQTCRYVYEKSWALKPLSEWNLPPVKFSFLTTMEILLDFYSTFKLVRGFINTWNGNRNPLTQIFHIAFWRAFIGTDRRLSYYRSLGVTAMSSIFEIRIHNYGSEAESSLDSSRDTSYVFELVGGEVDAFPQDGAVQLAIELDNE